MKTVKLKELFFFIKESKIKSVSDFDFYCSKLSLESGMSIDLYRDSVLIINTRDKVDIHFSNDTFFLGMGRDNLIGIRKTDYINTKFIYYFLNQHIDLLESCFLGEVRKYLYLEHLENLEVPLFKIEYQNKIVSILDKVANIVEAKNKSIELLNNFLKSRFIEMFGNPIINKSQWEIKILEDVAKIERGKLSKNDSSFFGGKYPLIQTGDIKKSKHDLIISNETLNDTGIVFSKKFNARDILMSITGSTIGLTTILGTDSYVSNGLVGIKADKEKINYVFLEMQLRFYRRVLIDTAHDPDILSVSIAKLKSLQVIIPPQEEQNNYVSIHIEISIIKNMINSSISQFELLKSSILQSALNDELSFDTNFDLDTLIYELDLNNNDDDILLKISNQNSYLKRLVDRLNSQEFDDKNLYNKAKYVLFKLISSNQKKEKVIQLFNENSKNIELILK